MFPQRSLFIHWGTLQSQRRAETPVLYISAHQSRVCPHNSGPCSKSACIGTPK